MIALDTNVLVRYLVEDDPEQARLAMTLIEAAIDRGERLFIPQIVLCETVWVLSYAYRFRRDEIVAILRQIRRAAQLEIEHPDDVRHAIESFADGKGDFADYLIAERSVANGCSSIATFDRVLHGDPRFVSPDRLQG
ncbi:MAG TPA: type II toxin-antitoxin system VapC family toxin [Thermoanaerobaculia bacterium]